ncbi:MAG TPA: serine/threonine-protein kinase [Polyangiaceae bacterium]|nr:serine/threonine-protein kinase [Polyangiaceae bacterium]
MNSIIDRGDTRIVVEAPLGEGAMGVVWRAWVFHSPGNPGCGPPQPVALKVLRAQPIREARELFVREAKALQRLSHPNVVAFHDLFEHQRVPMMAIEYVDGETLEVTIARHRARAQLSGAGGLPCMPFLRSWHYFQQLLGALAAAHALGIVHRDVKPSNVLVRNDGIVKLGDFGIARIEGAQRLAITSDFAPGTGAYMSPEQVLSLPIDGRSDLYSAATVLYEMLAGRTPFSADRSEFLVRKDQVERAPPHIRSVFPQAPPILDALFGRALAKKPEERFDSAIEMGDAFRTALGIPESPEWRAQEDIARAARTLAEALAPADVRVETAEKRLATLREFVVHGYKTKRFVGT